MKTLKFNVLTFVVFLFLTGFTLAKAQSKSEKQGWQLSMQSYTFHLFSVMESLDKTKELGLKFIEIYPGQKLGAELGEGTFGYQLSNEQRNKIKQAASERNIKIISSGVWTANANEWEHIFSFAKNMDMEFISAEPAREDWDLVEELAKKYNIKVAVHNHPSENSYWKPEILLAHIQNRSNLIGACVDVGHYKRMGLEPIECLRKLDGKVISFHFKDIAPQGQEQTLEDVVWGEGVLNVKGILEEMKKQHFKGYFTIEYEANWENNLPEIKQSIEYFNKISEEIF